MRRGAPGARVAGRPLQPPRQASKFGKRDSSSWVASSSGSPFGGTIQTTPVLLVAHGGPGDVLSPHVDEFAPYEKDFIVVQWDQRGSGRTYGLYGDETPELTLQRVAADGIELAVHLTKHLQKANLVVLGHSWGSVIAIEMATRRPDLFSAYVGTGQVASWERSVQAQFDFLLVRAQRTGDQGLSAELAAIQPLDPDKLGTFSPAQCPPSTSTQCRRRHVAAGTPRMGYTEPHRARTSGSQRWHELLRSIADFYADSGESLRNSAASRSSYVCDSGAGRSVYADWTGDRLLRVRGRSAKKDRCHRGGGSLCARHASERVSRRIARRYRKCHGYSRRVRDLRRRTGSEFALLLRRALDDGYIHEASCLILLGNAPPYRRALPFRPAKPSGSRTTA